MAQKFADAARSELVSGIGPADTSFDVLEGAVFPEATAGAGALDEGDWFKVVIQGSDDLEICYVRTHSLASAGAFSDVLRGQEGTTAASFGAGTVVGLRVTSVDLERFDPPEATKAQIEDAGNTTAYKMTPQRIWQAITKWWDLNRPGTATGHADGLMSKEDKAKLESIAIGATANDTDANLRDRSTHTGMQILATISDAGTAASKDVPASGNATAGQVVLGNDTRLSDARAPTSHTHSPNDITGLALKRYGSGFALAYRDNNWGSPDYNNSPNPLGTHAVYLGVSVLYGGNLVGGASGYSSTVSGGQRNTASGGSSTVSGGNGNTASGGYAVVSGGSGNTASGSYAVVSGGENNTAASFREHVTGSFASDIPGNATSWSASDYAFRVGIGQNTSNRADGFRVRKDGTVTAPELTAAKIASAPDDVLLNKAWAKSGYSTTTTDYPNLVVDSGGNLKRSTKTFGTASEATLTTSDSDTTAGRVPTVGWMGLGAIGQDVTGGDLHDTLDGNQMFQWSTPAPSNAPPVNYVVGLNLYRSPVNWAKILIRAIDTSPSMYLVSRNAAGISSVCELYHTGNTTVGTGGHLITASPIVKLSSDSIKTEGFANHGNPTFKRKDIGVYEITGTSGLRVAGGWYIQTPENRNGEKYFNLEWEQDKEPAPENGILKEPEPVTLTIKTFERAWNPQTGRFDNGGPVDIPEGRWIDLRFNEIEQPEEDEE